MNLLKTSIGSGVLNFPYLFKTYGLAVTVVLTVISGFFAAAGLLLLATCASEIGRSADMSVLSRLAIPHARFCVDLAVFVKCFGVSLSYVIIARQLLPSFLETVMGHGSLLTQPAVCLLFFVGSVAPLAFLRRMDGLKYSSLIGIASILAVIVAAVVRYSLKAVDDTSIVLATPVSILWLGGLGKFMFSFTCHQNIFAAHSEMDDNSPSRMRRLIYCVAMTSFVLYMAFGITNYLLYGDSVADNVLRNYPQDYLGTAVRGLYIVVMGVSYPLQMAPARVYLFNLLAIKGERRKSGLWHCGATVLLVAATYVVAATGTKLGLVYTIVGATASTFMCLVLPALFYFGIELERTLFLTIVAYCAFLFGICVFTTTLVGIAYGVH